MKNQKNMKKIVVTLLLVCSLLLVCFTLFTTNSPIACIDEKEKSFNHSYTQHDAIFIGTGAGLPG